VGGAGVGDELHVIARVAGQTGGGLDALLGADPADPEPGDAATAQLLVEVGGGERVVAGLGHLDVTLGCFEAGLQDAQPAVGVERRSGAGRVVEHPGHQFAADAGRLDQVLGAGDDVGQGDVGPRGL
jgi:hypothetical protein